MTITNNFEERRVSREVIPPDEWCYSAQDVAELLDHARALEAMLKDKATIIRHHSDEEGCWQLAKLLGEE